MLKGGKKSVWRKEKEENGLAMELRNFASSVESIENVKIRIYSEEFILRKPICSPIQCKKYDLYQFLNTI